MARRTDDTSAVAPDSDHFARSLDRVCGERVAGQIRRCEQVRELEHAERGPERRCVLLDDGSAVWQFGGEDEVGILQV
nr:hypothetical protein [Saccharopolyspora aridisoli]